MPVTIRKVLVSDTGESQSGQHHKLQTSAIAYSYTRPNGFVVTVSRPIIDGLAFTVPVPKSLEAHVLKKLDALTTGGGIADKVSAAVKANKKGSTKYLRSYEMAFEQTSVLMQVKPLSKTSNFLRVEMNPDGLDGAELGLVWELLAGVSESQISKEMIAEDAKITRMDIAVDMLNIDPEDILIDHKFTGKTNAYFSGDGGKVETIYLNKKSKGSTTYLYDKKVQARETGKSLDTGVNKYGEVKYTRLERRVQTQKTFKNLASLMNPLKKVDLVDMDGCDAPGKSYVWKLFQDACRYRGLVGALKLLPEKEREEFQKVIQKSSDLLWRPDDIWSFWEDSLKQCDLMLVQ